MIFICAFVVGSVIMILTAFGFGFIFGLKYSSREINTIQRLSEKNMELFKITIKWMKNSQNIFDYLHTKRYRKIGVYGMSYLGDCLVDKLSENGIEVVCGIDRNADKLYHPLVQIYSIEDKFPVADAIIVTTVGSFQQIKHDLERQIGKQTDIVALEEILYS